MTDLQVDGGRLPSREAQAAGAAAWTTVSSEANKIKRVGRQGEEYFSKLS